jgi:hypothetical protein
MKARVFEQGYLSRAYAKSLGHLGTPQYLKHARGWWIERPIRGFGASDGIGTYPLLCCENWSGLEADLQQLEGNLVSFAAVTDPFGDYDEALLHRCFRDRVIPFKQHFITDLSQPSAASTSKHHRYEARRALRQMSVEVCTDPMVYADDWSRLYAELCARHDISGFAAFPGSCLQRQLEIPGMLVLRAYDSQSTLGMVLWVTQGDVAYYHLSASSEAGYERQASYALFQAAIDHLRSSGVIWACLGAGAGTSVKEDDGLVRFKSGWATGHRQAYFCGRILDTERYELIVRDRSKASTDFFPAYRAAESG